MEVIVTPIVEQKVFSVTVSNGGGGGGGQGPRGYNGWSPMIRTVSDGGRRVQEVYDWTGGTGSKPDVTGWIGATGIVQDIALATDVRGDKGQDGEQGPPGNDGAPGIQGEKGIRGEQGEQGIQGEQGETGANGADGTDGESAYQIWLDNGNTGSEQDFLDSLVGPAGSTDYNDLQNKPTLGTASEADADDFATAAQGALADTAVQPAGLPTWATISGKPAFVAEGASASAARTSIGLGTAATTAASAYATAAQGELADTSIQPSDTSDVANAGKVVKYSNIGAVNTATPQFPENAVPLAYFDVGLSTKQNTLSNPSQAEVEGGSAATARSWSAQRDRQAIVAAGRLIVSVSANKTLALTDEYTYQRITAAATVTIPTNASVALPVGAEIDFFQAGAGAITFSPSSGVTVNSYEDTLVTDGKGAAATLKKVATNEWDLII